MGKGRGKKKKRGCCSFFFFFSFFPSRPCETIRKGREEETKQSSTNLNVMPREREDRV